MRSQEVYTYDDDCLMISNDLITRPGLTELQLARLYKRLFVPGQLARQLAAMCDTGWLEKMPGTPVRYVAAPSAAVVTCEEEVA